jgi:hypothetical protein
MKPANPRIIMTKKVGSRCNFAKGAANVAMIMTNAIEQAVIWNGNMIGQSIFLR